MRWKRRTSEGRLGVVRLRSLSYIALTSTGFQANIVRARGGINCDQRSPEGIWKANGEKCAGKKILEQTSVSGY